MKQQTEYSITLSHVTKEYVVHHEKPTLMEHAMKPNRELFAALTNISLHVPKGQRVGVIGPNGSGKTTLLKLIAGITIPTEGTVHTTGTVVSLIDIEAGFHPDLTGEQNIYLNGMLIGMEKNEIDRKIKHIVNFAHIGQFIDAPLHTYSEGMKYRLGFAIAVNSNPTILLLDEGIAVGDINFQRKFQRKIRELVERKTTIIAVTHWLEFVQQYCNRVIIMHKGKIIADDRRLSIKKYKKLTHQSDI